MGTEHDARDVVEGWKEGAAYVASLEVGQPFRGSMGEGKHRGLTGLRLRGFHLGAFEALQPLQLWTTHGTGLVCKLIRPGA